MELKPVQPLVTTPPRSDPSGQPPAMPVLTAPDRPTLARPIATGNTYDVESYRVLEGSTWERISELRYYNRRYAAALRAFNQQYELGTEQSRSGNLVPGSTIFIPRLEYLEQKFASLIAPANP